LRRYRLGLRWRHAAFSLRNRVERWFGTLKARDEEALQSLNAVTPMGAAWRTLKGG